MKPILKPISAGTHIQIKNILFTTDFSDAAKAAGPYAAALAKRYGAKLYALHVLSPIVNTLTLPENWRALEKIAEIEAQREKFALVHTFAGMHPEILINEGDLWPNIKTVIQEHDIDLIVMGTRGRSGIGKFLLGSAAEEIFRQAPCPVLTVGPHSPAVPKSSGEITRILLATDFGPESQAAATYAISLAQECQAYLTLLHVIDAPKTGDLVHPSELSSSSGRMLRNLVPPQAELWCVPDYVVEYGAPAEKILEIAAKRDAELIVLGVHKPSGFQGAATHLPMAVAHKVVSLAPCPVLTVRG